MDRKAIIILVLCFALMLLWPRLVDRMFPPPPRLPPAPTNQVAVSGPIESASGTNVTLAGVHSSSTPVIQAPGLPSAEWIPPKSGEELATIETSEAKYTFTSHGGGLKLVELKGFSSTIACGRRGGANGTEPVTLNGGAPVPALALFGGAFLADNSPYTLTRTEAGVRAEKTLTNGLKIIKEFTPGTNYILDATIRLQNSGAVALDIPGRELVIGTATPINRRDNGQLMGVQWFDGAEAHFVDATWFANNPAWGCGLVKGTPRLEYRSIGVSNVVWAAAHNQFFVMIAAPRTNAHQLVARRIALAPPSAAEIAEDRRVVASPLGYQTGFLYPPTVLAPGETQEWGLDVFAGPKEYNTLAKLSGDQDLAMRFGWGIFGWFARALLLGMNGLHQLGLSYGLSIIVITVIIKLLFWPLTQASSRSMKRMQALQPQMKAIQEKYKEDPRKMNQKLMEFMKEHKVSPLGGCLPLLLQIPVFIGFYQMLQSAIELRGARFLWACDLSQPDTVAVLFGFPINPLPLIMGATQFWQAKMTPVSPGVDPVQQKMMQYMPLIFIFILYNFSAGLALYWTVQNLLSILQMKLIRNIGDPAAPTPPAAARPVPVAPKKRK